MLYSHKCELPPEDDIVVKYIYSGYAVLLRRHVKRLLIVDSHSKRSISFLKSRTAIRYEQQRNLQYYFYTIHPFSYFRRRWEEFMALFVTVFLCICPIQVASSYINSRLYLFKYFVNLIFIIDIILNYFTGVLNRQTRKIVLDLNFVLRNYVTKLFIFDLLACMNAYEFLKMYSFGKYLIFCRVCKVLTLVEYLIRIRENWQISNYKFKIIILIIIPLICLLWSGAVFYLIGLENDEKWLLIEQRSTIKGYLSCFYRSVNCFFLLGNVVDSLHELSVLIEIFSMIFGLIFYLVVMAQILQIVNKYNSSSNKYYQITQEMGEYMKYKRLPESIRIRMYEYFVFRFQKTFYRESEIMSTISPQLQEEILINLCKRTLQSVPIFKDLPDALLVRIAKGMKSETYLQNDTIAYSGSHGDSMYFIISGTVAIYTSYGREVAHLVDGSYFGEIYLVLDEEKRVATVVAVENCELYNLSRKDFLKAVSIYPEYFLRVKEVAKRRLKKTLHQIAKLETVHLNLAQKDLLEKYHVKPKTKDMY